MKRTKQLLSMLLAIALVMSCITIPAFANEETLETIIDTPLTDMSAVSAYQGFLNATWAAGRCGLSGRTVYYTDGSTNSYMLFDAGKTKAFKEVTFDVTFGTLVKGDVTENSIAIGDTGTMKRDNLVAYGNTTDAMKAAGQGTFEYIYNGSADGGTGNYFTYTIKWTLPEQARYVRLNGAFYGNCGMFVHNAVLKGVDATYDVAEPELLVDSDMVDDTPFSESLSSGIYKAAWNGLAGKYGMSPERSFWSNNAAATYMVFDAGEGNTYTNAEFVMGSSPDNPQGDWYFTQTAHDYNRVAYSNDGATWTPVYAPVEVLQPRDTYALIGKITAEIPNARYIRVGSGGMWPASHGMCYHNVKLWGFKTPAQLLIDTDLADDSQVSSITGFTFVNWAASRCGYTTARDVLTTSTAGEIIFDGADDKSFTGAEFKITVHQNANWTVAEEVWRNKFVSVSNDGDTYTALAPAEFVQGADTVDDQNTPYKNYTLTYEFGNARYVKFAASSLNANLYVHDAKLYGKSYAKDLVEVKTSYFEDGYTAWRYYGNIAYNGGSEKDLKVVLAVYEGKNLKKCAIKSVESVTADGKDFYVTAVLGEEAKSDNATVKLFVITDNLKPYIIPTDLN